MDYVKETIEETAEALFADPKAAVEFFDMSEATADSVHYIYRDEVTEPWWVKKTHVASKRTAFMYYEGDSFSNLVLVAFHKILDSSTKDDLPLGQSFGVNLANMNNRDVMLEVLVPHWIDDSHFFYSWFNEELGLETDFNEFFQVTECPGGDTTEKQVRKYISYLDAFQTKVKNEIMFDGKQKFEAAASDYYLPSGNELWIEKNLSGKYVIVPEVR